jgi:hypothetical protein
MLSYNNSHEDDRRTIVSQATFSHQLYLVHHLPTNSYGSVFIDSQRGLACFKKASSAKAFAQEMETRQNLIIQIPMADACEVAAGADLEALVLVDAPHFPLVHSLYGHKSRF